MCVSLPVCSDCLPVHILQPAPVDVSAEAANKAESSSSDFEEEVGPGPVEPRQAASDRAWDGLPAPDPAAESSAEHKEDDDELKQVSDLRLNPNYVTV